MRAVTEADGIRVRALFGQAGIQERQPLRIYCGWGVPKEAEKISGFKKRYIRDEKMAVGLPWGDSVCQFESITTPHNTIDPCRRNYPGGSHASYPVVVTHRVSKVAGIRVIRSTAVAIAGWLVFISHIEIL